MKKNRRSVYGLLFVVTLLMSLFTSTTGTAGASSVFDGVYATTSTLQVGDVNCEFQADITDTWSSFITDEVLWGTQNTSMTEEARLAFIGAQHGGDVSVSQVSWRQTPTRTGQYVAVYFSVGKTSTLEWSSWNQAVSVKGYQYGLLVGCNSGIDATHPTVWLFSTPANQTTGTLSQNNGISSPITTNFFTTAAQNLPDGYAGATIATQSIPLKYVAMGDSFSSGEGNPPFESGTDIGGVNECHRSSQAYPRLLESDSNFGSAAFVACSGATTTEVVGGKWGEVSQINALSEDTRVVTITAGGNDILFKEFAISCVAWTCAKGSPAYNESSRRIKTVLPDALRDLYTKILAAAPNAQVYVLDYPQVAPVKNKHDLSDPRCWYMHDSWENPDWSDAKGARDIVEQLDAQIKTSVDALRAKEKRKDRRIHYVPVNGNNSPFKGHTVCSGLGESYFNNVDTAGANLAYVFHPNARGQQEFAKLIKAALLK